MARRMRERQEHYLRFARDPLPRPRRGRTCRRLVPAPLHVGHSALFAELTNAEHSLRDGYVHMQLDGCQQLLHEPTGGESSRWLRAAGCWSPCSPRGGGFREAEWDGTAWNTRTLTGVLATARRSKEESA
jgi:hypothetical protein